MTIRPEQLELIAADLLYLSTKHAYENHLDKALDTVSLFTAGGLVPDITFKTIILLLKNYGKVDVANKLEAHGLKYLGEEIMDTTIINLERMIGNTGPSGRAVIEASIELEKFFLIAAEGIETRSPIYASQVLASNPVYTLARSKFHEDFSRVTGENVSTARLIRLNIRRNVAEVTWSRVKDINALIASIEKYIEETWADLRATNEDLYLGMKYSLMSRPPLWPQDFEVPRKVLRIPFPSLSTIMWLALPNPVDEETEATV